MVDFTPDQKERLQRAQAFISSHDRMARRFSLFKIFHLFFTPFRCLLYVVGLVFCFFLDYLYEFSVSLFIVLLWLWFHYLGVDYAFYSFLICFLIGLGVIF